MRRRLILGAAGSGVSFGILKSLREHYREAVFVIAIDSSRRERSAASLFADAFVQVPLARSPEFAGALARLAETYPGSDYLPVHDEEIAAAARLAVEGKLPPGLRLIAPPYEVVRLCNDKWHMHHWLQAHGLPTPSTALASPEAIGAIGLPAILKPRVGNASQGVRLVRERSELAGLDPEHWLLQELLDGPVHYADALLSWRTGAFFCACRVNLSGARDYTTVRGTFRLYDDPALAACVERIARGLPLFGAFNINALRSNALGLCIIDVNPRVGLGTRMSAAVGADIAAANLADYWGDPTGGMLKPIVGEYVVAREYVEYITYPSPATEAGRRPVPPVSP